MAFFFFLFLLQGRAVLKEGLLRKLFDACRGILVVYDEVNLTYFSPIKLSQVISLCRDFRGARGSSLEG